jgi:O-antigen/teichoic acid export membrane protein
MTKVEKPKTSGHEGAKRVAKNTGFLFARMAITVFISLYTTRLILGALGVDDFGIYILVGGLIALLGFLNSSMATATQRFMSFAQGAGEIDNVKRIFNMSTLLHAGIAIIVVIVLEIAGYFFFNGLLNIAVDRLEVANWVYQFMVVSTFFTIISVPYAAVIISHENMRFYAVLGIVESILKLAIALYITYGAMNLPVGLSISAENFGIIYSTFDNLIIYGFLMAVLSVVMIIVRRVYCHRKYAECKFNFKKYYDKNLFKQISHFAGWSFLGASSSMIANYGQGIVINVFFGTAVNAAQGIAVQVGGQLGVLSNMLIKALNPMIVKSEGSGDRALMLKATMMGSKVSFFLSMALYIPMLIEMPYILNIWLKNVPDFAVMFCKLLLIRSLIEQIFIPLASAIAAEGNIKRYQVVASVLTFLPLPISYMFFKFSYPAYTLYVIFVIYSIIASAVILYYAKKNCQLVVIEFLISVISRCVVAFLLVLLFSLFPYFLIDSGFIRFLSVMLVNFCGYFIIVFFIGFSSDERIQIIQLGTDLINKLGIRKSSLAK